MKIIVKEPYENGAYPSIQEGDIVIIPEGYAVWPDTLDTDSFCAHNGFVTLTIEQVDGVDAVTDYEPNVAAWEAWKASLPDPEEPDEPGDDDADIYDEMAAAYDEGVQSA